MIDRATAIAEWRTAVHAARTLNPDISLTQAEDDLVVLDALDNGGGVDPVFMCGTTEVSPRGKQ